MNLNFFDLVHECGLEVFDIAQAPREVGYYLLFADTGEFIYVGKADNLRDRLADHFGPSEENERIKGIARYAIWEQTQSMTQAEEAEGNLYDTWVRNTGLPPFANKNKPPTSKMEDNEILLAKLRQLLREQSTLSKRLDSE
jgi:predicted GIY-YIG superfamily endonuclease